MRLFYELALKFYQSSNKMTMHSTAGNKIDKYCSTGGAGRRIAENGKILWCTALVELF